MVPNHIPPGSVCHTDPALRPAVPVVPPDFKRGPGEPKSGVSNERLLRSRVRLKICAKLLA